MYTKYLLFAACASLLLAGCSKQGTFDAGSTSVRISSSIVSRATELNFESGDCIGLTVADAAGARIENLPLTYDNGSFSNAKLTWSSLGSGPLTFQAYYPYRETGLGTEFTVAADQRGGCASSDLLGAVKQNVSPTSEAVPMLFYHLLSQLDIVVNNDTSSTVAQVTVSGFVPTAGVDLATLTTTVSSQVDASDIVACEITPGELYRVILIPQRQPLTVTVRLNDGSSHTESVADAALEGGCRYDLSVRLSGQPAQMDLALSGEIAGWIEGGTLVPDDSDDSDDSDNSGGEEGGDQGSNDGNDGGQTPDGTLDYAGESYRTTQINGVTWMAGNLRYVPDASMIGKSLWYPEGGAAQVGTLGMLYSYDAAMNGAAAYGTLPVRGICPPGWHIPSQAELEAMMAAVTADFITDAWYYNGTAYLMGVAALMSCETLGAEDCVVLKKKNGEMSVVPLPLTGGFSLRCVMDD